MQNRKIVYKKTLYKKGFAFSITMWIIASLLFATVVILRFAKEEVGLSQGLNDKIKTQLTAQSVFEALKFYVPTADYTLTSLKNSLLQETQYPFPTEMVLDGREYNVTQKIQLSIKDTSMMLNVTYDSSTMIAKALTREKEEELSAVLKDSLEDWRDEDNLVKVNGAEENTYRSLGQRIKVRNTNAIQDIHELQMIQGFDELNSSLIESNLYYGRGTSVNLMLMDNRRYLSTLLGVDEAFMQKLLELRESEPLKFRKTLATLPAYNDDYMGFWLSKQLVVKIEVHEGRARSILKAILTFKQLNERPYMILSYRLY